MSGTYLALNIIFLALVVVILYSLNVLPSKRVFLTTTGILLVLTMLFDPVIIALGIVDYDPGLILGLRLFGAPVEDFFYSILAAVLMPAVWNLTAKEQT
jgi:lycopene cyclase domain-containing protein